MHAHGERPPLPLRVVPFPRPGLPSLRSRPAILLRALPRGGSAREPRVGCEVLPTHCPRTSESGRSPACVSGAAPAARRAASGRSNASSSRASSRSRRCSCSRLPPRAGPLRGLWSRLRRVGASRIPLATSAKTLGSPSLRDVGNGTTDALRQPPALPAAAGAHPGPRSHRQDHADARRRQHSLR
jgi:hypothetical protein